MKAYALTGGIASGKSSLAIFFKDLGVPVIDADEVVHSLYEPGQKVHDDLVTILGKAILNRSGEINRKKLSALLFNDPNLRKKVEALVHPATREKIAQQLDTLAQEGHSFALVEAALMVESNYYQDFAGLIVIYVDEATQIARLMSRNKISENAALKLIASQLPLNDKLKLADWSIDNTGTLEESHIKVRELFEELS